MAEPRGTGSDDVGYLCGLYPALSLTFILREVEALRSLGVGVKTYSIRSASGEHLLSRDNRNAHASTRVILSGRPTRFAGTHLWVAVRHPGAYLRTLATALRLAPPGWRGRLWQLFYFAEAVVLWDCARHDGVNHIHAHLANVASDVALLAAELGRSAGGRGPTSWSFTMHGPTEFYDITHHRLAEKTEMADFVLCISDFARSQLMGLIEPGGWDRLHIVHCGIPLEEFQPQQKREPPADESADVRIVVVGRLVPEKGNAVLLESIAELQERGVPAHLTVVGAGPEDERLRSFARRLGIADRVKFAGAVGQDEIRQIYAEADIFCTASFAEGVPVVLMEAMALGVPVVATQIMGIPELVRHGESGVLVPPGRQDLLADALENLAADPALRRRLADAARDVIEREFDVSVSARRIVGIYEAHGLRAQPAQHL